jgi:hypothetical protein
MHGPASMHKGCPGKKPRTRGADANGRGTRSQTASRRPTNIGVPHPRYYWVGGRLAAAFPFLATAGLLVGAVGCIHIGDPFQRPEQGLIDQLQGRRQFAGASPSTW